MERPVLVTGGAGFIGRHLVSALCAKGQRVRVLVRRQQAAAELTRAGAEPIVGDLLDPGVAARAASGVSGVFHLAGRLFAAGGRTEDYRRLHVDATVALLEACGAARPDFFLLCSTTGVHGPTGSAPAREDDAGHPQNAYEVTKAQAERAARDIAQRMRLPLVIARPGLVYGPGDRHLLGWFRAIKGGYYRVIGPGTNRLHPIYIDDAVRALMLCASAAPRPTAQVYHLVGSNALTMRELSDAIGAALGRRVPTRHLPASVAFALGAAFEALPVSRKSLPLTRARVRFMLQNRAYDGSRALEELGFTPQVELAEGLSRTVAWYRENGLL